MKKIVEKLKTNKMITKICVCVLVFVVAAGGIFYWSNANKPELTTYVDVDPEGTITISEEEVPLGNTKVITKKSTKTTKKKVKLKKAAKKTRTVKKPKKTQITKKTTTTSNQVITVQTTKETAVTEKYKKNARQKVVTTKVTITVQTTTTDVKSGSSAVQSSTSKSGSTLYTIDIQSAAPKADESVRKAFETLGFTVTVNFSVSYSGYFNAKNQQIILKQQDDTIYHELGHFVAFLAGNVDKNSAFVDVYNVEKRLYTGANKAYSTQSSAEYFAESYKDYVLQPKELKRSRPQTYEIINNSVEKLTDSYVAKIKVLYGPVWK